MLGKWLLMGAAFTAPISKSLSSFLMALSATLLLGAIIRRRVEVKGVFRDLLFLLLLGLACLHLAGLLWSEDLRAGLTVTRRISYLVGIYVICGAFLRGPEDGLKGVKAIVLGTVLLDLMALGKFFGLGSSKPWTLPAAVLMNPIWFGNVSAVAFYGSLFLLLRGWEEGQGLSKTWLVAAFLNLSGVLLSNSRGPYGATAAVLILVFLPVLWRRRWGKGLFLALVALLGLVVLHPAFQRKIKAAEGDIRRFFQQGEVETSLGARLGMWILCLEIFRDHPLLGAGTGDYEREICERTQHRWAFLRKYNQPHSIFFYTLALHGGIGLGLLIGLFVVIFRESLREIGKGGARRSLGSFALATSLHYLISGLTETLIKIHVLVSLFGLALGMAFAWRSGLGAGREGVKIIREGRPGGRRRVSPEESPGSRGQDAG